MQIPEKHAWDLTPTEARRLQVELAAQVNAATPLGDWQTLAAADVSFDKYSPVLFAGVVVVRRDTFQIIERSGVAGSASFPYVPGLLSFREAPALLEAFRKLQVRP